MLSTGRAGPGSAASVLYRVEIFSRAWGHNCSRWTCKCPCFSTSSEEEEEPEPETEVLDDKSSEGESDS